MKPLRGSYLVTLNAFALTELIVVIAIISILATITTIAFNSWQVKHNIEAQVKQMVTDFSELRMRAMTRKQRHSITLNAQSYVFRSYSSENEALTTAGAIVPGGTFGVKYPLLKAAGVPFSGIPGEIYQIDERGLLTGAKVTIWIDDSTGSASLNCVTVHTVRTSPGKSTSVGGTCDDK